MMTHFEDVAEIPVGFWDRWPHFSPLEVRDRMNGSLLVVPELMDALEALRNDCGFPLPLSSAYRTPAHSASLAGGSDTDPHTLGLAVDIAIVPGDQRAFHLVLSAGRVGFTGIELASDHIHLDIAPSKPNAPRPLLWISQ